MRLVTLAQAALRITLEDSPADLATLVPLVVIAAGASAAEAAGVSRRWMPPLEAALAGVSISVAGAAGVPALPYLVVPPFAAGLQFGWAVVLASVATSGAMLLLGGLVLEQVAFAQVGEITDVVQWLSLAVALGFVGWWGRRQRLATPDEQVAYEAATQLLADLRELAPRLTFGLDAPSLAEALLDDAATAVPYTRAVVLAAYPQGRVQLLAARNADDEWISAAELSVATHPDGPHHVGTVHQNVSLGQKALGVVVLDTDESIAPRAKAAIGVVAQRHRLRLEAATVFGEVRQIATREERLRLSREIHDGIAQDVAALAYSFDDALSTLDEPSARRLRPLREDLSRIIRELRLSVFDLRDSNAPQLPLSAAISEHARRTASLAHLELHLSVHVDDSPLDADVERELTRIAQEAVTNAHKHSGARTLWVRVETDRRSALIEVADDGVGIVAEPRYSTGSGLRIMRERASTIGAEFSIGDRPGGGTVLRVTYGGDHQ